MHPLTTCKTSDTIVILETLFNKLEYGGPYAEGKSRQVLLKTVDLLLRALLADIERKGKVWLTDAEETLIICASAKIDEELSNVRDEWHFDEPEEGDNNGWEPPYGEYD